ncbi:cysteine proteinase [Imleria badia]|nr:cysteine proteinase [Imleria badia]
MAIGKWISFTQPVSAVSDTPLPKPLPIPCTADGKQFGLENFGNTCYANSVLQALYFCSPFRDLVIQHTDPYPALQNALSSHFASNHPPTSPTTPGRRRPDRKSTQDPPPPPPNANGVPHPPTPPVPSAPRTLFSALRALYIHISQNPADKGTVAPRAFIEKLRELNEAFRNTMHQDAHEFLNYLLNRIVEEIEEDKKQQLASGDDLPHSMKSSSTASHPLGMTASTSSSGTPSPGATFIHRIFEGTLTSETRCLTCENLSSRDESFLDLSIDIEQNASVTACLRQFSASEMLCQKEKFFCDACCDLQEAERSWRRMKIKRLPNVLALHLKRFKYQEDVQKYIKLTYRVAFPLELRLFNTVDDIPNPDRLYELFAIVVHIGNGPNHGHYISIIKTMGTWLVFDDDTVDAIKECDIPKYFGDSNSGSAYVLYYQALDVDLLALGLTSPSSEPVMQPVAQSEPPQHLVPTDSPVSTAQSIPPLPPGLTDDLPSSPTVPEALPRPTTPPIPIPLEPPGKSPRKTSSQFFKVALGRPATIGHKPSRNDPVIRPSRSVVDEKFASIPKPTLPPIAIFAKEDLKPLESHSAGVVNGKEKDSDRSMMGWLRRRSTKVGKPRPSSELNADIPPLPHDVLAAPGSPVRNQSTGSSSNSSKDSRRLDSPTPGHASPRVSPRPISRLPPHSWTADTSSPYETESRQSSASGGSYTTPASPPPDRRSHPRPLPAIPASPQTPQNDTSSPFSRTSLDHNRVQRRPGKDSSLPSSPKSPARPATSAGLPTKTRAPLPSASPNSGLQVPSPNLATGRLNPHKDPVVERPKSAHASYGFALSPPTGPLPPLPPSATLPVRKPAMRKLSLSAPMLAFVRRDKDKQ